MARRLGAPASAYRSWSPNHVDDLLRVWTNFWPPSLKLVAKERDDRTGKIRKQDDTARTPSRRRLASGALDATPERALAQTLRQRSPPPAPWPCAAGWPPPSSSWPACRNGRTSASRWSTRGTT